MELRHLRTVAAIARHGSFTRAGEELYLSQSAISQQVSRLERELGFEVFRRTSRKVELTPRASVILDYAQRVLAEVDGLHSELEELTGLLRGQLRIGGVYPTGPYDLFGMLADFRAAHPDVAIHMVEDTQDDVLAALRADELDCAFTALDPDALGDEFAATLLWEEEFVVALPVGHALCARDAGHLRGAGRRGPHRLPRELGGELLEGDSSRARTARGRRGSATTSSSSQSSVAANSLPRASGSRAVNAQSSSSARSAARTSSWVSSTMWIATPGCAARKSASMPKRS